LGREAASTIFDIGQIPAYEAHVRQELLHFLKAASEYGSSVKLDGVAGEGVTAVEFRRGELLVRHEMFQTVDRTLKKPFEKRRIEEIVHPKPAEIFCAK